MVSAADATKTMVTTSKLAKNDDPYHIIQRILAEAIEVKSESTDDTARATLCEELQKAEETANSQKEERRDFWSRANVADCVLVRALLDHNLEAQVDTIVKLYREAQSRGASLREWRSIVENLDFIRRFVRAQWKAEDQTRVLPALRSIYEKLEFFLDERNGSSAPQGRRTRPRRR
ncbi:MAG: hypothetical protein FJ147_03545 [Deltaproteobacteria bacterium]|nr:hypothetical protein [Deltaproteobacteria bacterium]